MLTIKRNKQFGITEISMYKQTFAVAMVTDSPDESKKYALIGEGVITEYFASYKDLLAFVTDPLFYVYGILCSVFPYQIETQVQETKNVEEDFFLEEEFTWLLFI